MKKKRGGVFGQHMIDRLRLFLFQKLKERIENNVKIIYVWHLLRGDRTADGYGAKFSTKKKWRSY